MVCYSGGTKQVLYSDWSKHERGQFSKLHSKNRCNWSFQIPVVNSHMTLAKLRADWNAQILFPGPRIIIYIRPLFPHRGWGLGRRLHECKFTIH